RDRALLDHLGGAGPRRSCHVEGALMNDASFVRQATRLDAIPGRFDPWLLGVSVALAALGVVMVASSSIAMNSNPFYFLSRHMLFLAGGIALAAWAMRTELKTVEKHNQA